MFTHILVPVDGSAEAAKALEVAAVLAQAGDAQLTLLHVAASREVPDSMKRFIESEHLLDSDRAAFAVVGERILQDAVEQVQDHTLAKLESELDEGDPATRILAFAKENAVDCIVMGSRGLGLLKGMLMGSVSYKVNHLAHCSVILVR